MPVRYPLIGICVAFIVGIILDHFFKWNFFGLVGAAAGMLILAAALVSRPRVFLAVLWLVFIFLGALHHSRSNEVFDDALSKIKWAERREPMVIHGVIMSDIRRHAFFRGSKISFTLEVQQIKTVRRKYVMRQKILVNIFKDAGLSYGDRVVLEGKLHRPFEFADESHFSYRNYLRQRGISYVLSVGKARKTEIVARDQGNRIVAASFRLKNRLTNLLSEHLSAVEAALVQGMILGDQSGIPPHIRDLFVRTGTAHILAISGFNVGIVAFLVFLLLRMFPIGRPAHYLLTILFLIFYAFLVGGQPSVVRATIMAIIFLSSFLLEREADTVNSLAFAALILLVLNPLNIFDVGFQLSFLSVFFIIHLYPKIMKIFTSGRFKLEQPPASWVAQSLAISIAAEIGVAPLIAYYFDIVTPVTILANVVIVPLMSLVVALGLGLLLIGGSWTPAALAFAGCLKLILNLTVGMIYILSRLPGAYFYLPKVPLWIVLGYYLILVFLLFLPFQEMGRRLTKILRYAKVNPMKKMLRILLAAIFLAVSAPVYAFWIWTPETNKWVNPKYDVKETPKEQLDYAMGMYNAQDYDKAINEFNKLVKYYPRAKEAPEAKYYVGLSREKQGKLFEAFKAYQEVIDRFPFSERSSEIVAKQYALGNQLMEQGKGKSPGGIFGSEYDVVEIFRKVIKNAPYGEFAAPSQYKIGLYLQGKLMYQEARDEFEKVVNDYPESEWAKAAQYQIALSDAKRSSEAAYDQKVTQSAEDGFKEFVKSYPDAELSTKAQQEISRLREKEAENYFIIAQFYEKQKSFDSAKIYYNTIVNEYAGSPWASKSLERIRILTSKKK